jgi:hypothetical protein
MQMCSLACVGSHSRIIKEIAHSCTSSRHHSPTCAPFSHYSPTRAPVPAPFAQLCTCSRTIRPIVHLFSHHSPTCAPVPASFVHSYTRSRIIRPLLHAFPPHSSTCILLSPLPRFPHSSNIRCFNKLFNDLFPCDLLACCIPLVLYSNVLSLAYF